MRSPNAMRLMRFILLMACIGGITGLGLVGHGELANAAMGGLVMFTAFLLTMPWKAA